LETQQEQQQEQPLDRPEGGLGALSYLAAAAMRLIHGACSDILAMASCVSTVRGIKAEGAVLGGEALSWGAAAAGAAAGAEGGLEVDRTVGTSVSSEESAAAAAVTRAGGGSPVAGNVGVALEGEGVR